MWALLAPVPPFAQRSGGQGASPVPQFLHFQNEIRSCIIPHRTVVNRENDISHEDSSSQGLMRIEFSMWRFEKRRVTRHEVGGRDGQHKAGLGLAFIQSGVALGFSRGAGNALEFL